MGSIDEYHNAPGVTCWEQTASATQPTGTAKYPYTYLATPDLVDVCNIKLSYSRDRYCGYPLEALLRKANETAPQEFLEPV
jgi:hypothetical protein